MGDGGLRKLSTGKIIHRHKIRAIRKDVLPAYVINNLQFSINRKLKKKFFFGPFGPQFGLQIRRGGQAPPGPSPGSATVIRGGVICHIFD